LGSRCRVLAAKSSVNAFPFVFPSWRLQVKKLKKRKKLKKLKKRKKLKKLQNFQTG